MPVIGFEGGLLRAWRPGDVEAVREASADPSITSITTVPQTWTPDAALAYVERQRQRLKDGEGYSFAIANGRDRVIGAIGLWTRDVDLGRAALGYWIVGSARGSGYAAKALAALAGWAFDVLAVPRLELYIEPGNRASTSTALRAGFTNEGLLRSWQEVAGERKDMLMFSRVLPDGREK